jgi:putative oxidoreductase
VKLPAFLVQTSERSQALGLLLPRAAAGVFLVPHGILKLVHGAHGVAHSLATKGLPAPNALAYCAAFAELLGGLCLALGFLARPAGAVVAFTMTVAWTTMHTGDLRHLGTGGGSIVEYPILLSILGLAVAIAGPGPISLDRNLSSPAPSAAPPPAPDPAADPPKAA